MEEEKIDSEQADTALTKEEILKRSRNENSKNGDEREQRILLKSFSILTILGLIVLLIVHSVNALVLKRNSYELIFTFFLINGINTLMQGIFGKKLKVALLVAGIMQLTGSVIFLVLWIMTLVA